MKDLDKLVQECKLDIESLGFELGNIADITINTKANRWGRCKLLKGNYYISISSRLLQDDIYDMVAKDTIAHELLHTIKGGMSHKGEWKRAATMMNECYGYEIKRITPREEKGISDTLTTITGRAYKYELRCEGCGSHDYYIKLSKVIKSIKAGDTTYRCGECKGKLVVIDL